LRRIIEQHSRVA
jgi:hypothetical protein